MDWEISLMVCQLVRRSVRILFQVSQLLLLHGAVTFHRNQVIKIHYLLLINKYFRKINFFTLGDFALLVRSGMTPFQALFYNYLSANSVYLGCAIGIIFGSDLESARWIFAISGATSLYLGLAVLVCIRLVFLYMKIVRILISIYYFSCLR